MTNQTTAAKFYTLTDIAREVGLSRQSLYSHMKDGNLRAQKMGRFTVVSEDEARRFKSCLKEVLVGSRPVQVYQQPTGALRGN